MKTRLIPLICLLFLAASTALAQTGDAVKMEETTMTIPTYPIGDPDPNPIFYTPERYQGAQMHMYPYPYLGYLTNRETDRTYKALTLENEYIRIVVLPELGGRLYIARDKTNNYDFFYYNRVVKPALIGMAGAWMSGGVEWNIPHHHRASTFMPVDYRLEAHPDGSKTIWVGEYEKRHGARWAVGLTLRPGAAYVETSLKYLNVTPHPQSILMWMNTAVHANENYQVFFPTDTERATFHSKTQFTDWPISKQVYQGIDFTKGVDVSWWKNISSPTSFFAWDTKEDFLAGIDHGKKAGTVIVGNHHIFPGKKVWYWGNNEVQRLWDQMLTDEDGPYLELMMGMYSDNQPDYSWTDPFTARTGTSYYYPIKDLSGLKKANRDMAVNFVLEGRTALIEIYPTVAFPNARLVLRKDGAELHGENLSLSPATTVKKSVNLDESIDPQQIELAVLDSDGRELISYTTPARKDDPVPEPYRSPEEPAQFKSPDELYLAGLRLEQFGDPRLDHVKYYEEALKRDPNHILTNTRLGIHYHRLGLLDKAEEHLRVAVGRVTANHTRAAYAEPLYYLGAVLLQQEKLDEAYDVLYAATWSDAWTSPAYYLLATIDGRRGDFARAMEHIEHAITANGRNTEALALQAALLRRNGETDAAQEVVDLALSRDPLNLTALNEKYLLDQKSVDLKALYRDEADNYLLTAGRYGDAGLYEDAIGLLELAAGSSNARLASNPLIHYALGFYAEKSGRTHEAGTHYAKAATLPVDRVFPWGFTTRRVLEAAVEANPQDAHALYLLGNTLADSDPQKAANLWKKAIAIDGTNARYYRNLAFVQAQIFDEITEAVKNIEKAVSLAPDDPRILLEADTYYEAARRSPAERLEFLARYPRTVSEWDQLNIRRISLLNFAGRYDESIDVLKNSHFYVAEVSSINPHSEWSNAHLYRGIGRLAAGNTEQALADFRTVLDFPRNLEVVRDARAGIAHYWIGKALQAQGKSAEAKEAFEQIASFRTQRGFGGGDTPLLRYYAALALRELGQNDRADAIFRDMIEDGENGLKREYHDATDLRGLRVRQERVTSQADAWLSIGLAQLGTGDTAKANESLRKVLELEPGNIDAYNFLNNPDLLAMR